MRWMVEYQFMYQEPIFECELVSKITGTEQEAEENTTSTCPRGMLALLTTVVFD